VEAVEVLRTLVPQVLETVGLVVEEEALITVPLLERVEVQREILVVMVLLVTETLVQTFLGALVEQILVEVEEHLTTKALIPAVLAALE
jgi:hypothetical protein